MQINIYYLCCRNNKQTGIRKTVGLFARLHILPNANIRQFFFSAKQITNKITNNGKTAHYRERRGFAEKD